MILGSTGQLRAQAPAVVLVDPHTLSLEKGETRSVVVRIENAANVYGIQVNLTFEPNQIKVLDADENQPGVQLLSGDFLTVDEGFEAVNEADNELGRLVYAYARLAPAAAASGSGALFSFEVEALRAGPVDLLLGPVIIASPEGAELPVQVAQYTGAEGAVIVSTPTATALPEVTAVTAKSVVISPTATAAPLPTATGQSAPEPGTATTEPAAEAPLPSAPAGSATAPIGAGQRPTRAAAAVSEREAADRLGDDTGAAATTTTSPGATLIAAVLSTREPESSPPAAEAPTVSVAVIGQNLKVTESVAQAPASEPRSQQAGQAEGVYLAVGLILIFAALIAIWFLRRLQHK